MFFVDKGFDKMYTT